MPFECVTEITAGRGSIRVGMVRQRSLHKRWVGRSLPVVAACGRSVGVATSFDSYNESAR